MPCNGDCNQGRECNCGCPCPKCKTRAAAEPHICPYADELYDDKTLCTCCTECEHNCADDI